MHILLPKLYKCTICRADGINEQNMANHQAKLHSDIPGIVEMFELSTKGHGVRCDVCRAEMKQGRLAGHMRRVHPEVLKDAKGSSDCKASQPLQLGQSSNTVTINTYKCKACDASGILEPNLIEHHSKKHKQIPINTKIFDLIGSTRRDKCNGCDRYIKEGHLKAHNLRFHSKVRQDGAPIQRNRVNTAMVTVRNNQFHSAHNSSRYPFKHYKCNGCPAANILARDLNVPKRHRKNCSREMLPYNERFEVMIFKKPCKVCKKRFWEEQLKNHMKIHHPRHYASKVGKVHKCDFCDAWCMPPSFKKHHATYHSNIPFANNHFKFGKIKLKFPCDFCGKRIIEI